MADIHAYYRAPSRESIERGQWAETMFRDAAALINHNCISDRVKKPDWLTWIDPPTVWEDMNGADGWARTDRGDIPLQVKSSRTGAREHKRMYPKWNGIVFVIKNRTLTLPEVAVNILSAIKQHRGIRPP